MVRILSVLLLIVVEHMIASEAAPTRATMLTVIIFVISALHNIVVGTVTTSTTLTS
jgi:hypothetical protein